MTAWFAVPSGQAAAAAAFYGWPDEWVIGGSYWGPEPPTTVEDPSIRQRLRDALAEHQGR
jgi:hypothetical protein